MRRPRSEIFAEIDALLAFHEKVDRIVLVVFCVACLFPIGGLVTCLWALLR